MTASISPDDAPKQNEYENDTLDAKHIRAIEKERRLLLQVALKGPLTILTTYTGTIVPHILTSFQFWSTILGYWLVRTLVRCERKNVKCRWRQRGVVVVRGVDGPAIS
jgi:hypothetical protein